MNEGHKSWRTGDEGDAGRFTSSRVRNRHAGSRDASTEVKEK